MYNIPKNYFMNPELTEITEQTIDELHRNDENAENSENIVEQSVVVNLSLSKEGKVEDEDDVYKPIAVSPDGRFFKYEEEVSKSFRLVYDVLLLITSWTHYFPNSFYSKGISESL